MTGCHHGPLKENNSNKDLKLKKIRLMKIVPFFEIIATNKKCFCLEGFKSIKILKHLKTLRVLLCIL